MLKGVNILKTKKKRIYVCLKYNIIFNFQKSSQVELFSLFFKISILQLLGGAFVIQFFLILSCIYVCTLYDYAKGCSFLCPEVSVSVKVRFDC